MTEEEEIVTNVMGWIEGQGLGVRQARKLWVVLTPDSEHLSLYTDPADKRPKISIKLADALLECPITAAPTGGDTNASAGASPPASTDAFAVHVGKKVFTGRDTILSPAEAAADAARIKAQSDASSTSVPLCHDGDVARRLVTALRLRVPAFHRHVHGGGGGSKKTRSLRMHSLRRRKKKVERGVLFLDPDPGTEPRPVFGVPLCDLLAEGETVPPFLELLLGRLHQQDALTTQGIFRLNGRQDVVTACKDWLETGGTLEVSKADANDVAGLLKLFLRELPEALCTNKLFPYFLQAPAVTPHDSKLYLMHNLVFSLPPENRKLLERLVNMMAMYASYEEVNSMGVDNLAIVFGPNVFRHPARDQFGEMADTPKVLTVTRILVNHRDYIFKPFPDQEENPFFKALEAQSARELQGDAQAHDDGAAGEEDWGEGEWEWEGEEDYGENDDWCEGEEEEEGDDGNDDGHAGVDVVDGDGDEVKQSGDAEGEADAEEECAEVEDDGSETPGHGVDGGGNEDGSAAQEEEDGEEDATVVAAASSASPTTQAEPCTPPTDASEPAGGWARPTLHRLNLQPRRQSRFMGRSSGRRRKRSRRLVKSKRYSRRSSRGAPRRPLAPASEEPASSTPDVEPEPDAAVAGPATLSDVSGPSVVGGVRPMSRSLPPPLTVVPLADSVLCAESPQERPKGKLKLSRSPRRRETEPPTVEREPLSPTRVRFNQSVSVYSPILPRRKPTCSRCHDPEQQPLQKVLLKSLGEKQARLLCPRCIDIIRSTVQTKAQVPGREMSEAVE